MRYADDAENQFEDEVDDEDEYDGYAVVDDEGNELTVSRKAKKKAKEEENWDDGEIPEASPIPQNEQTVMIDNAVVEDLQVGTPLTLVLDGDSAAVFFGAQRVGDFKPAFVKKLKEERGGMYAVCTLFSTDYPVMVKLCYAPCDSEGATQIVLQ